jgi:hypothetical protein
VIYIGFHPLIVFTDGYAFSIEENGAVAQTDLIRAYNTTEPKPSGQ